MERTEPALAPQWLRCAGNVHGGGTSVHHSDVPSSVNSTRSRYFRSNTVKDSPRFLDSSSLSNSKLSSNSDGSAKHPYSSFTRSHRDKNRDREKEKSFLDDILDHDSCDPMSSISSNMDARSTLRRSRSLVSRKLVEVLPHRRMGSNNNVSSQNGSNGLTSGINNAHGIQKAAFEKDFPSLVTEEKQRVTGVKRILSPGLGPSVNSGFLGCEKWTSALVEVPASLTISGNSHPPSQQSISADSASASGTSNTAGLNMAEALSKHPARVRATHQLPDNSQRLEELAIKQSRQLIPMTPSVPKPLVKVPSSADKLKQQKIAVRTNEIIVASRAVHPQPHSSHLSGQSRAGQIRSDSSDTPHIGKFLVLKPGRENGPTTGTKEASSPTGDANGRVPSNGLLAMAPPAPTAFMSPNISIVSKLETKAATLSLSSRSNVDRRHSQSLARSRSEFFNLMRRKTSNSVSTDLSRSSSSVSSPSNHSSERHAPINSHALKNGGPMIFNGDGHDIPRNTESFSDGVENNLSGNGAIYPDEEEAAFLRSLGWEENVGEDEGLTEEEINAFYQEYMNRMPSLKVCSNSQLKCSASSESQKTTTDSESTSSKSESES